MLIPTDSVLNKMIYSNSLKQKYPAISAQTASAQTIFGNVSMKISDTPAKELEEKNELQNRKVKRTNILYMQIALHMEINWHPFTVT